MEQMIGVMEKGMPREKLDVTCSIVTYNSDPEELRCSIQSVFETRLKVGVFVIDNSPTDSLRQVSESNGAKYRLCSRNLGFGAGHNLAMRACLDSSKYHLVLNPDARLEPGALESVFRFLEEHPRVGLLSPRVLFPDGTLQYACKLMPSPFTLAGRRFLRGPLARVLKKQVSEYELRDQDFTRVFSVPVVAGFCMFCRCEALKQVGLFDERFFMYLEDYDLSRRIKSEYDVVYYPDAQVIHRADRGSYKHPHLLRIHILSAIRYFNKWGWFFDNFRKDENRRALSQSADTELALPDGFALGIPPSVSTKGQD